jgi:hypothetical protein
MHASWQVPSTQLLLAQSAWVSQGSPGTARRQAPPSQSPQQQPPAAVHAPLRTGWQHRPSMQMRGSWQMMPQPPQFGSLVTTTQVPPQQARPPPQAVSSWLGSGPHSPSSQTVQMGHSVQHASAEMQAPLHDL